MAERWILAFFFFLWRTENCCALTESGGRWSLQSRTRDGTNVRRHLDLWSRRLTRAGKARDWNRRVQEGDIWECVAFTLTTLACGLRVTLDAFKVSFELGSMDIIQNVNFATPFLQILPLSWNVLEHLRQYLIRSLFSGAGSGTPSWIQILCRVPLG